MLPRADGEPARRRAAVPAQSAAVQRGRRGDAAARLRHSHGACHCRRRRGGGCKSQLYQAGVPISVERWSWRWVESDYPVVRAICPVPLCTCDDFQRTDTPAVCLVCASCVRAVCVLRACCVRAACVRAWRARRGCDVQRRKKHLLALQAIKRAVALAADDARVHRIVNAFFVAVDGAEGLNLSPVAKQVRCRGVSGRLRWCCM